MVPQDMVDQYEIKFIQESARNAVDGDRLISISFGLFTSPFYVLEITNAYLLPLLRDKKTGRRSVSLSYHWLVGLSLGNNHDSCADYKKSH